MPRYSDTSRERLTQCHPDLQILFFVVIERIDHSILCGHRGQAEQDAAFAANTSTVRWPDSKHNQTPSMAVDAAPYFAEIGNIDWSDIIAISAFAGRVLEIADRLLREGVISHRVRWGGDWDLDGRNADQAFNDLVHFELIPAE